MIFQIKPASIIAINGAKKSVASGCGYIKKMIAAIHPIFISFQKTAEKREKRICKKACMRASIEEFISEKTVKTQTIAIDTSVRCELYHGRKYAIARERKIILIQRTTLRVIMFPMILEAFSGYLFISLIDIV